MVRRGTGDFSGRIPLWAAQRRPSRSDFHGPDALLRRQRRFQQPLSHQEQIHQGTGDLYPMGVLDQSPVTDPSKAKDPLHDLIRLFDLRPHLRLESSKMLMDALAKGFHQIPPSGSRPCRRMGGTAKTQRCARRWCTILTTTNLHYQRAQPSPLWFRLCLESRIGRRLAWIPRVLRGKAQCGAGPACPPPAWPNGAPHERG